MWKRVMRWGMVVIVVTTGATPLGAQTPQTAWGNWPGTMPNPLGLTTEQMMQIQEITVKWQGELLHCWTRLQTKRMELQGLMWNSTPDPAAVEAKSKEVSELQVEIQRKSLEQRNAIREVLSDRQKAIYDQTGMAYNSGGPGAYGLGMARGWGGGGRGRGRAFGRAGRGVGFNWAPGSLPGVGATGWGLRGSGWGRGPCGMGLGRMQMSPGWGQGFGWSAPGTVPEPKK